MSEPEQGLFFHVSSQLLGSSSLMSWVITYHSLAMIVTRPLTCKGPQGHGG